MTESHIIPESTEIRIVEETRNGAVTTRRVVMRDRVRSASAPHLTSYTDWTELCVLAGGDQLLIDVRRRSAALSDDVEIHALQLVEVRGDEHPRVFGARSEGSPIPSPAPIPVPPASA
jgi:hypothetical protein